MTNNPSPIYDFAIGCLDAKPRTGAQITREASRHFKRKITDGSIGRALRRAQDEGLAKRLDDLTWVDPEEWEEAQRRARDPHSTKAVKLTTTKTSSTGLIPALSGRTRAHDRGRDLV